MFNALSAVKFVASTIVGIGSGKIVSGIIKNNVSAETLFDKVAVLGAAWMMGGMASKATRTFSDDLIDETAEFISESVKRVKLANKLARINRHESSFKDEGLDETDFVKDSETGRWKPVEVVDSTPVRDETFEKMNKMAEENGIPASFVKIDGKWTIVDK
jgi:hypothetical protein